MDVEEPAEGILVAPLAQVAEWKVGKQGEAEQGAKGDGLVEIHGDTFHGPTALSEIGLQSNRKLPGCQRKALAGGARRDMIDGVAKSPPYGVTAFFRTSTYLM